MVAASLVAATIMITVRPADAGADACHPDIDANRAQYIIGYGSLMQEKSRRRIAPNAGESQPVLVSGYERAWNVHGPGLSPTTYLGVVPNPKASFNAVIYSLPGRAEIIATDAREVRYCRGAVAPDQIEMLDVADVPEGQIWLYVILPGRVGKPDMDFPIVQSYVDIFMGGCVEIGEAYGLADFAGECVRTTSGWSEHWVNDRIMPRRPFAHQPLAGKIDTLLQRIVPQYLKARVIE